MVFVQDPGSPGNVKTVFVIFSPGEIQHRIQIIPDHCAFRHHGGHLEEAVNLFVQPFQHFFRQRQRFYFFPVLFRFRVNIFGVAQFLADDLDLLPQVIFFLVLFNILMHLLGNVFFQFGNRHFLMQDLVQFFQPGFHRHRFQKQLFCFQIHIQITGNGIRHNACIRVVFEGKQYLRTDFFAQQHPLFKLGYHHAPQRFQFQPFFRQGPGRQFRKGSSPAAFRVFRHPVRRRAEQTFYQDPHSAPRQFQHLSDFGHNAYPVQICQFRFFFI